MHRWDPRTLFGVDHCQCFFVTVVLFLFLVTRRGGRDFQSETGQQIVAVLRLSMEPHPAVAPSGFLFLWWRNRWWFGIAVVLAIAAGMAVVADIARGPCQRGLFDIGIRWRRKDKVVKGDRHGNRNLGLGRNAPSTQTNACVRKHSHTFVRLRLRLRRFIQFRRGCDRYRSNKDEDWFLFLDIPPTAATLFVAQIQSEEWKSLSTSVTTLLVKFSNEYCFHMRIQSK